MTSTILDVNIDRSDPLPLHEQAAARIRRAIADGEAGPGERLPLAKDLAAVPGVNKNTVLRALHLLRDEGLLEFRRGRGITVAGTPQRGTVLTQARSPVQFARRHGYGREELARHGAHTFEGLLTRTVATLAAHTLLLTLPAKQSDREPQLTSRALGICRTLDGVRR